MIINSAQREIFTRDPSHHLLRLGANSQLIVEEKSIWTWIKANALFEDEYDLRKIVSIIKTNEAELPFDFLTAVDMKVIKYNKDPRHTEKIEGFPKLKEMQAKVSEVVDARAKQEQLKSFKNDQKVGLPVESAEKQFIEKCVANHLKPYLDGTITPQNENRKRGCLVDKIVKELKAQFPRKKIFPDKVREVALTKYCEIAAWKFCTQQRQERVDEKVSAMGFDNVWEFMEKLPDFSLAKIDTYVLALEHSLPIDFPELILTRERIRQLGTNALINFINQYKAPIDEMDKIVESEAPKTELERAKKKERLEEKMKQDPNDLFL